MRCGLRRDGERAGLHGQGAVHPRDLPAQLPPGATSASSTASAASCSPAAWAAGAGPGDGAAHDRPRLDASARPTASPREGARHPGYSGARGYHPLLAVAAGTGEVLMARLREGRANTARGAAHFLRETVGRVRAAGASGQLTMRADSGFYNHAVVSACRALDVRFSVTIRQQPNVRTLIEAIPEADWRPLPYWLDGRRRCRRDDLHAVPAHGGRHRGAAHRAAREADARLTARALRGLQLPRLHQRSRGGDDGARGRPSPARRDRERDPRPQVRRRAEPSPLGPLRRRTRPGSRCR